MANTEYKSEPSFWREF